MHRHGVAALRKMCSEVASTLPFAQHIATREIANPFPGIAFLEKDIGRKITARIGSNESIPPPSNPLEKVLPEHLLDLCRLYPDPYCRSMRDTLADLCGTTADEILVDAGADALICLVLRVRVNPGDTVVTTAGTYPTFKYFAGGVGAEIAEVAYKDDPATGQLCVDLEALAAAASAHSASVVYLANPDNPTGHVHSAEDIQKLRDALPAHTTLIVDEAYIDFSPSSALPQRLPNTIQLRTLSKAYALAGLRVGYCLASPEWILKADTVRIQYGVNNLSNYLAETLLADKSFSKGLISETVRLRDALRDALVSKGLKVLPSSTNFVCIRYGSPEEALARQKLLWNHGAAVHRPPHPAMHSYIRVSAHPQSLTPEVIHELSRQDWKESTQA